MRQIINEWREFCEEGKSFRDGHFYTLFMENITPEEIKVVYRTFPNSERLISRMTRFLFDEVIQIPNGDKQKRMQELIKLDFHERKPILDQLPSFTKFNLDQKFIFREDTELIAELILDDIWIQEFHDRIFGEISIPDRKTYELIDAHYGITSDFDYQLFLSLPLLNTDYSMKDLYEFKKAGGVYAITETEVVYSYN